MKVRRGLGLLVVAAIGLLLLYVALRAPADSGVAEALVIAGLLGGIVLALGGLLGGLSLLALGLLRD